MRLLAREERIFVVQVFHHYQLLADDGGQVASGEGSCQCGQCALRAGKCQQENDLIFYFYLSACCIMHM